MTKVQIIHSKVGASSATIGVEVNDYKRNSIDMSSGSQLEGDEYPFPEPSTTSSQRLILPRGAFLAPEGADDAPASAGDEYEYESAGGVEFPREILDSDFYKRVAQRYRADTNADGSVVAFSLLREPEEAKAHDVHNK
jgi:hypothetical protein